MARLIAFLVMTACLSGMAVEKKAREVSIEKQKASPNLDGVMDESCWKNLQWNDGFSVIETGSAPSAQTRFKVFHDGTTLYFGVECDEPSPGKIVAKTKGISEAGTRWMDDCVEISLAPDGKGTVFYKTIANSLGETTSLKLLDNNIGKESFSATEWISCASAAAKVGENKWMLEIAIPLASMDHSSGSPDGWKLNVGRNRHADLKKIEFSVFNPIDKFTTVCPAQFAAAKLGGFSPDVFNWQVANLKGKVEKKEGKVNYTVTPTIFNKTGEFRIFQARASLRKDGKIIAEARAEADLRHNISREIEMSLPVSGSKDACEFRIEIRGADGSLWKTFSQQVDVSYQPIKISLLRPAYRGNIYSSMQIPEIVAEINCEMPEAKEVSVELSGKDGILRKASGRLDGKAFTARIKADDLPEGAYKLTAGAVGEGGEGASASVDIRKLPPMKGEVFLDEAGAIRVDGKTFLPSGWFDGPMKSEDGINVAQTYSRFKDVQQAVAMLDKAAASGVKLIITPHQELTGKWEQQLFNRSKHRQGFLSDEQKEKLTTFVNAVKNHPAVFGWYMSDEPEAVAENPEWHMQVYNLLKELDPHHPCLMLNYGVEGMRKYYKPCDIIFPDCYPNFIVGGDPIVHPLWSISKWTRTGVELGRATMIVPQGFCYSTDRKIDGVQPNCRAPTFEELRNQAYQVFANDGKGIVWYSYPDWSQPYHPLRLGPAWLGREMSLIKDLLLSPNVKDAVAVETKPDSPNFQCALKKLGKDACVVAVNTSSAKTQASFLARGLPDGELHVMGENRKVPVKNGRFADEFGPVETHIYLSDADTAGKLPLSQIREEIAAAEKARFKKGNIAAVGEKTRMDYVGMKDNTPDNLPKISASSDATFYFTKETGSLCFLLDGICESTPNRVEMTWSPLSTDKNPFVEIRLPRPATVREVKLYTLTDKEKARVTDGRVLAELDGKLQEVGKFAGNSQSCASIKFEPVKTQTVRVTVDRLNPEVPELRALSEIEVYGEYAP